MPEIWDLWLPYDNGKKLFCRLELLYRDNLPRTFSIYRRRIDYKEIKPAFPRIKNAGKPEPAGEIHIWGGKEYLVQGVYSFVYNFEYNTGKLLYVVRRGGDFSKAEFRWSDLPRIAFECPEITARHIHSAKSAVIKLKDFLEEGKNEAVLLKEQERYGRFLSPLEKILAR